MIIMPCQIQLINIKVMISIQLPELAVNHVKVFIAEERHDLIDILLLLQQLDHFHKIRLSQLRHRHATRPTAIHAVVDASNDRVHVARMKFCGFSKEREARVSVYHILDEGRHILRKNVLALPVASTHYINESRGGVVAKRSHSETEFQSVVNILLKHLKISEYSLSPKIEEHISIYTSRFGERGAHKKWYTPVQRHLKMQSKSS